MMSALTSRKFRLFSIGISARLAPLSLATCSGSVSERSGLMLPWTLMSPRTSSAGLHGRLAQRRVGRDEERDADLGLDAVAEQVDHLDVEVRRVEVARDAELGLLAPACS